MTSTVWNDCVLCIVWLQIVCFAVLLFVNIAEAHDWRLLRDVNCGLSWGELIEYV